MACRSEAQRVAGITPAQHVGLGRGRQKGKGGRRGRPHGAESKRKTAEANRRYWAEHPDQLAARGAKTRGEAHCFWKGGVSKLNESIRRMTENRKWMDAVKARDGRCVRCGSTEKLESHHRRGLAVLIVELGIKDRDDARANAEKLWDLDNGETLCERCHYQHHGRAHHED
jgi:5-methylcytosine-specific restriction endonuclease McrA